MEIKVKKLTDVSLVRRACEMTCNGYSTGKQSKMTLGKIYDCEHSPMRTQIFWIELLGIPTFVSVHLVRHKIGVEHFVLSNREDRGGQKNVDRNTPVNHGMLLNAQELINMSRKRLCLKSRTETRDVMLAIRYEIREVDPDLAMFMMPECEYRRGCHELQTCGWWDKQIQTQLRIAKPEEE
jgi:hypothetical protein